MASGLYKRLTGAGLLLPHTEEEAGGGFEGAPFKVLRYPTVPFISYPYEWCFSQLKDAALLTLEIQKLAIAHGMSLKDASAFNIQFYQGRPLLIDTTSFELYDASMPWVAYRQFCQHFLAPLALMRFRDARLGQLTRVFLDGIPLDIACGILPLRARFSVSRLLHLFLHARSISHYGRRPVAVAGRLRFSQRAMEGLLSSLTGAVKALRIKPQRTEWEGYYSATNYSERAAAHKQEVVARYIDAAGPRTVWDMGANMGVYSRIASQRHIETVAFDLDPQAVEKNYRKCRDRQESHLLPLVMDITNPTPACGWAHEERRSLRQRASADVLMALALVHHLAISNHLPFARIAAFFAELAPALIIEFVPRKDSQVQLLLLNRKDIFTEYTQEAFERAFGEYYTIEESTPIEDSCRRLYYMVRKA